MKGKRFFFEKKNQKTSMTLGHGLWFTHVMAGLDLAIHA
jgi:hypothetical protein